MLLYLKCNVLHLMYHGSWIEHQRFLEPYTLIYEVQCDPKITWIFYSHKIQQQLQNFTNVLHFQKIRLCIPELFGDLFFHCFKALEKLFTFFVSLLYDLMVINVSKRQILLQRFFPPMLQKVVTCCSTRWITGFCTYRLRHKIF